MRQRLYEDSPVLAGWVGYRDSDPFIRFVVSRPGINAGTTNQTAEDIVKAIMSDEADRDCGDLPECVEDRTLDEWLEHMDTVHQSKMVSDIIEERLAFLELSDGDLDTLERDGVVYLDA